MTHNAIALNTTGDYPLTSGGYYANHYCTQYPCPLCNPPAIWNPPVYIQPSYVPYYVPVPYTIGTIVFAPDKELTEEVKKLKEEIKKLRKELKT